MPTATIRPDAVISISSQTVTGAADAAAALSDDSDASYVTGNGELTISFADPTIPAGAQIRSVTPRCRVRNAATARFEVTTSATGEGVSQRLKNNSGAVAEMSGAALATNPDGTAWTTDDLDNLHMRFETSYVTEAYLDIDYNKAPVVNVTAPDDEDAGTAGVQVKSTSTPTVEWTFTDDDTDQQERYWVKTFSGSTSVADPDTETARLVDDSGEQFTKVKWHDIETTLTNGDYIVYVKAADIGSGGRYSSWDSLAFTVAVDAPPEPTIAATYEAATARVELVVTVPAGGEDASFVRVECSDDTGTTWAPVRGCERLDYAGPNGSDITVYDYEAPVGVERQYRARSGRVI